MQWPAGLCLMQFRGVSAMRRSNANPTGEMFPVISSFLELAATERVALSIVHAITPVFMLSAVATLFNALHARSARLVDHARMVKAGPDDPARKAERMLRLKFRYARIRRAMVLAVFSGILTTLMVLSMFVSAYLAFTHLLGAAAMFFLSLILFCVALIELVRELMAQHDEFDEEMS